MIKHMIFFGDEFYDFFGEKLGIFIFSNVKSVFSNKIKNHHVCKIQIY